MQTGKKEAGFVSYASSSFVRIPRGRAPQRSGRALQLSGFRLSPTGKLKSRRRSEHGFTLVELMIVMLIIGVLAAIAIPSYMASLKSAKEAVLKEDLHVMRQAIDAYTMDKEQAPQSLDDLVQSGYLKVIPSDPMTHSNTTWVTTTDDTLMSVDQTAGGVGDVHSGSEEVGTDGQPYSSW